MIKEKAARQRAAFLLMRKNFAIALLFFAAACAHTTTPPPVETPPAVASAPPTTTPPCNPGHAIVNAALWIQTAAEYRAAALQTYATAKRMLDAALADPNWVGAAEETANDPAQPPAVILDADETAIANNAFESRVIRAGKTYDGDIWTQWVSESAAGAVPGAADFLAYAKSKGVTPFFITNRDADEELGTRRNLEKLGYPLDPSNDTLLLRGEREEWKTSDKSIRRAFVASKYRVLLVLGDDLNDFANARDKSVAERDAIIDRTASWWGTRWFMIPNPMYGSWERAVQGSGTPCEQLERKVEALKP